MCLQDQTLLSHPCFTSNICPLILPRYLHLDIIKHVMRNVRRFCLTLLLWNPSSGAVEMATVTSSCAAVQNEVHVISMSRLVSVLSQKVFVPSFPLWLSYSVEVPFIVHALPTSSQTVFDFLSQRHNKLCNCILDIMDYFLVGKVSNKPISRTTRLAVSPNL